MEKFDAEAKLGPQHALRLKAQLGHALPAIDLNSNRHHCVTSPKNECDSCHMCASTQHVVRSTQILQHDHICILGRNACCIGTRLTTPCHNKLSHQAQELQPRIKIDIPALCWLNAQVTGGKSPNTGWVE